MITIAQTVIVLEDKDFKLTDEGIEDFIVPFGLRAELLLVPKAYKDALKESLVYDRLRGNTHVGSELNSKIIYYNSRWTY